MHEAVAPEDSSLRAGHHVRLLELDLYVNRVRRWHGARSPASGRASPRNRFPEGAPSVKWVGLDTAVPCAPTMRVPASWAAADERTKKMRPIDIASAVQNVDATRDAINVPEQATPTEQSSPIHGKSVGAYTECSVRHTRHACHVHSACARAPSHAAPSGISTEPERYTVLEQTTRGP